MDRYSGKRDRGGLMAPRKGYSFRDPASERDQNVQYCNRIGCSGRIKYSQNIRIGNSKHAFRSSNGKGSIGNSSGSSSSSTTSSAKISVLDSKRKLSPELALDPSESSVSAESEASDLTSSSNRSPTKYESENMRKSGKSTVTEIGSSSVTSNHTGPRTFYHKSRSSDQNTAPASSVPLISKSSTLRPLNNSSSNNRNRYGLRNLKCNSISDVVPPGYSSLGSTSVGKNEAKNKNGEGEISLPRRGRKSSPASSADGHLCPSSSSISISDSRRGGSLVSGEDGTGAASARNQRSVNMNSRIRASYRQSGRDSSSLREPPALRGISQVHANDIPFNVGERTSSQLFPTNNSSSGSSSYRLSSSNDDNASPTMPFSGADLGFTHFMNRDGLRRYNMDGIAEVLLALQRIEQDEELTHEQVLALETSLFLSGLNFYDQHRDMRLDIDNMSYEELLALEERMGTVSTALPEEALSKCIKRSIYQASEVQLTGLGEDEYDIKCSICQEEYGTGDEIGNLVECQHGYHASCIDQWLRLKNWCPICKAAAAPSQTSAPQ